MTQCDANGQPVLSNPDLIQASKLRDLIRAKVPPGPDGYVVEDLDVVLRRFIPKVDEIGRVRLVEVKFGNGEFDLSQKMTFGMMDHLMRISPKADHYAGFYLVRHWDDDWDDNTRITINGKCLSLQEFLAWCSWQRIDIPPFDFRGYNSHLDRWLKS